MKRFTFFIFWCFLGLLANFLVADPIVTDRPDFTESASIVPLQYRAQFEMGYTFATQQGDAMHTLGDCLVRVPLAKVLELRVVLPSYVYTPQSSGLSDMSVGVKYFLSEGQGGWPDLAVIGLTSIPLGSPVGEHHLQPTGKLCMDWDFLNHWTLSSNLILGWTGEDSDRILQGAASWSLGYSWSRSWGSYWEYYLVGDVHVLNTGVSYLVSDDVQFDLRVGKDIHSVSGDYFVGTGVSVRL